MMEHRDITAEYFGCYVILNKKRTHEVEDWGQIWEEVVEEVGDEYY